MKHVVRINERLAQGAAETLGITLPGLTEEQVVIAYRYAAQQAHPDAGGSTDAFLKVKHAKDVLTAYAKQAPREVPEEDISTDCMRCSGKGFIMQNRGWRSLRIQCPSCRGKGFIIGDGNGP